jgi:hypothetical protein
VIIILADDLGFSDSSFPGGNRAEWAFSPLQRIVARFTTPPAWNPMTSHPA